MRCSRYDACHETTQGYAQERPDIITPYSFVVPLNRREPGYHCSDVKEINLYMVVRDKGRIREWRGSVFAVCRFVSRS
jgi:hypothetical protein